MEFQFQMMLNLSEKTEATTSGMTEEMFDGEEPDITSAFVQYITKQQKMTFLNRKLQ